ncbi:anti-sigma factor [Roseisalinus antarcticus]|uniref:Regulator of SigK n=1 Tax=Roseisalinus antarcticus TaxID=254357 RepID=A0A1Y5SG91_9RHOB|nr:anti-sigma factor [Roseisalinus antarcticus]SLN40147.1 Anti-sigma-K factor rskA [Roseisalinus antarcticus]
MTDSTGPDDDGIGLAAEYVLGLLSTEERAACDTRLETDPVFRAEVAFWAEQLATLAVAEVQPVAPPARLQARIERALFPDMARAWWRRLGIVPSFVGAAAAAGLVWLSLSLGWIGGPQVPAVPTYQAELAAEDGSLVVRASVTPEAVAVNVTAGGARTGRALELWLIAGEAAPVSLGLLPEAETALFSLPEGLDIAGALLAVSDEPPGGSPTGAPTGDVLAAGPITAL